MKKCNKLYNHNSQYVLVIEAVALQRGSDVELWCLGRGGLAGERTGSRRVSQLMGAWRPLEFRWDPCVQRYSSITMRRGGMPASEKRQARDTNNPLRRQRPHEGPAQRHDRLWHAPIRLYRRSVQQYPGLHAYYAPLWWHGRPSSGQATVALIRIAFDLPGFFPDRPHPGIPPTRQHTRSGLSENLVRPETGPLDILRSSLIT